MPTQDNPAETAPTLFMPGDEPGVEMALVRVAIMKEMLDGCRVRMPGITPGLKHYVCTPHDNIIRKMSQETRR